MWVFKTGLLCDRGLPWNSETLQSLLSECLFYFKYDLYDAVRWELPLQPGWLLFVS